MTLTYSREAIGSDPMLSDCEGTIADLLSQGVANGIFSHATAGIATTQGSVVLSTHDTRDVFDVASLTKTVTSALALKFLGVQHRVDSLKHSPTVQQILCHSAGLPPWRPYFALAASRLGVTYRSLLGSTQLQEKARSLVAEDLLHLDEEAPIPTYSDIGFIALGLELERCMSQSLAALLRDLNNSWAHPRADSAVWGAHCPGAIPTGLGRPRAGTPLPDIKSLFSIGIDRVVKDTLTDDDNAAMFGVAAGHAGLWATGGWMVNWGRELLESLDGGSKVLSQELGTLMLTRQSGMDRTVGLDASRGASSQSGNMLTERAICGGIQTGFTGCSLCLDVSRGLSVVLLSDATAFERPSLRIRLFRPFFHNAIAAAFDRALDHE
jgi:CubicO group peptidase (beta-lactamase class C family)